MRRCRPGRGSPKNANFAERVLSDRNWRIVEALGAFASQRGHTLLELAMSWLASQPTIASIIAGATKPEQVEQNVARRRLGAVAGRPGRDRSHNALTAQRKFEDADSRELKPLLG